MHYQVCLGGFLLSAAVCSQAAASEAHSDPLLSGVFIDHLEYRWNGDHEASALEAEAWVGGDLDKLWIKTKAEKKNGNTEAAELQALYSKAITPYWDLQIGARHDFQPSPSRSWAVLALHGLAPYFFEVDAALFVGEAGRSALRLGAEYDLLLSQRLILSPAVEANFRGENDRELNLGSGLTDAEVGLRLRYEIRREFAPYMGVHYSKHFGNTADLVEQGGADSSTTQWLVGLRAWF